MLISPSARVLLLKTVCVMVEGPFRSSTVTLLTTSTPLEDFCTFCTSAAQLSAMAWPVTLMIEY